jgi:hypothetical protein
VGINGSGWGNALTEMLLAEDIQPGDDVSYELCKTIYLYHPLGAKMAESPVSMAQSQRRQISIQDAPDEVVGAFLDEWEKMDVDALIHNWASLSRVYGIASIVMGSDVGSSDKPLDMTKIWKQDIYFNVWDPLNTAGSLILSQIPTSKNFNKPVTVRSNGQTYHPSRFQVMMNEHPVYIAYTNSAFGYTGRSVYQRALFPLKSFVQTMFADDVISLKTSLIVAQQTQPSSVITKEMQQIAGIKRNMLKQARNGNVISVGKDEDVHAIDMTNVDTAGTYARTNILKNIATAADMPAKLLENETMVAGFGEGVEDAKNIARYIERVREKLEQGYTWFDNIIQYRAWNPDFFATLQAKYPKTFKKRTFEECFSEWRANFSAVWPSFLIEPESEAIKTEQIKLEAVVAFTGLLLPNLDPENKARVMEWAADCVGDNKRLFPHEIELDISALEEHLEEQKDQESEMQEAALSAPAGGPPGKKGPPAGGGKAPPKPAKFPSFKGG